MKTGLENVTYREVDGQASVGWGRGNPPEGWLLSQKTTSKRRALPLQDKY